MFNTITLVLLMLLPLIGTGAEDKNDWLSFDKFVEVNMAKKANQESLIMLLKNPNPEEVEFGIRFSINRKKTLDAVPVYVAIWNNNQEEFPDLNMEYLRQPTILLAVAGALSKIRRCSNNDQYKYVIDKINENDQRVLPYAILALGYVGNKTDLNRLSELAKQNDGKFLFQASFSILEIDYDSGIEILKELKNSFGQKSGQAKLLDRIMKEHKPNKARNPDGCAAGSL